MFSFNSIVSCPSPSHPFVKARQPSKTKRSFTVRMTLTKSESTSNKTLFTSLTKLLWGQSLPPGFLISVVRLSWNSVWHLMMSQMAPADQTGAYSRPASKFRLGAASPSFSPSSLHLYVGIPCPWAHRALIVRALKGLESTISVSVASPGKDGAWEFLQSKPRSSKQDVIDEKGSTIVPGADKANGCRNLREVYGLREGGYDGRATVPMLWDAEAREVVCNESYDIIEFFNSGLNEVAQNPELDLSPTELKSTIEEWNRRIYTDVNNGVYRVGFAQSQVAYDQAVNDLFSTLDHVDNHLASSRYLCGDRLTLADVCLFTTLIRFDLVYNVLFKCTKKKMIEYLNLHAYLRDIYQMPKIAETCNFQATMDGYFGELFMLNPGCIRPVIPSGYETDALHAPHHREALSSGSKSVTDLLMASN